MVLRRTLPTAVAVVGPGHHHTADHPTGADRAGDAVMAGFAGIDHLSLSVTDLDVSERFYTGVLDFSLIIDFGEVRVLFHRPTGFVLSIVRHAGCRPGPFSELNPGIDHVGLAAGSREELVAWERRFARADVVFTPIRDMPFGSHLNFRDPDGIPLEFFVSNDVLTECLRELAERDVPQAEIRARVEEVLGVTVGSAG